MVHQIDSKKEWLLLSAFFTAKFGLVFVLTLESAFSYKFHFKANVKSTGSSSNMGILSQASSEQAYAQSKPQEGR